MKTPLHLQQHSPCPTPPSHVRITPTLDITTQIISQRKTALNDICAAEQPTAAALTTPDN